MWNEWTDPLSWLLFYQTSPSALRYRGVKKMNIIFVDCWEKKLKYIPIPSAKSLF